MTEPLTAREVIGRTLFREVPAQADGEDLDDVTDMVLAALRQHGYTIILTVNDLTPRGDEA